MFEKKPKIIDLKTIEDISRPININKKSVAMKSCSIEMVSDKKVEMVKNKKEQSKIDNDNIVDSGDDILWL